MNTKKITVLEKAIQMLENGTRYYWGHANTCNCGIVASAAINKPIELSDVIKDTLFGEVIWTHAIEANYPPNKCPITGLNIGEIQESLMNNGFTKQDLLSLEYLRNQQVIDRVGVTLAYNERDGLIAYLRAWVEILKEQDTKEPKERVIIVRIAVPESITVQAKESLFIKEKLAV